MKLGILYHMPFWQTADGAVWEAEGSFARYVDSLAPYFDEVILSVPVFDTPPRTGTRIGAANVRLSPLPYFPGPRQFYPMLPAVNARLRRGSSSAMSCTCACRRPPRSLRRIAQRLKKRTFLLVVGDYRALPPHLPYRGVKKLLFAAYVAFEEWALRRMVDDRADLHQRRRAAPETRGARAPRARDHHLHDPVRDVATRPDTCAAAPSAC